MVNQNLQNSTNPVLIFSAKCDIIEIKETVMNIKILNLEIEEEIISVPEDTIFIRRNDETYYEDPETEIAYKVLSEVENTKERTELLLEVLRIPIRKPYSLGYCFVNNDFINYYGVINTQYGWELNIKDDGKRYLIREIKNEKLPTEEKEFKQIMKKYEINVPIERVLIN